MFRLINAQTPIQNNMQDLNVLLVPTTAGPLKYILIHPYVINPNKTSMTEEYMKRVNRPNATTSNTSSVRIICPRLQYDQ